MVSIRAFAALVIVTSLASGCAESPSPASPSSELTTGTWMLVSMQPAGQAAQTTPAGARYTVTFTADRVSMQMDCNMCGGAFALSGQTVTLGPALACTKAACATMAFENMYTSLVSGESTATVSGSTLMLSSPRGVLRYTR